MTHGKKRFKLGRNTKQRKALIKNLAASLILHERIETTLAKAKFLKPYLEKLITKARVTNLNSRRQIAASLGNGMATKKMIEVIGPVFKDRGGGYLKITRLGNRSGDNSPIALVTFSEEISQVASTKAPKKEKEAVAKKTKTKGSAGKIKTVKQTRKGTSSSEKKAK